jgi:trehalose 6-phosphate synthase/phosphatase
MKRFLIVSNRLPVSVVKRRGRLHYESSAGGLATALSSVTGKSENLWIGWSGLTEKIKGKDKESIRNNFLALRCVPVFLRQVDIENFYYGFCNRTIWPLFHYFPLYAVHQKRFWEAYVRINRSFCDEVLRVMGDDDMLWIHDYHLMLLPQLIREKRPRASIGFFLHIPFPSVEIFRLLPSREEILRGVLGSDLIGFHTFSYVGHFLTAVRRLLGHENSLGLIRTPDRVVSVDAFPIGIDYEKFHAAAGDEKVKAEIRKLKKRVGDRKVFLSVDRLDYTKGIQQRLEAFDLFLEKNAEWRGKVTLILLAIPSRAGVEHYAELKKRVDETVGKINGKYGTIGWVPIWYLYRSVPFPTLAALYAVADVGIVTPMRDGMNLVAKEFVASRADGTGVLVLSEMAGAAEELGEALIVNPNSKDAVATALGTALEMGDEEQVRRNRAMQTRLSRYDVNGWAADFIDKLGRAVQVRLQMGALRMTESLRRRILGDYGRSTRRLILLDYDGTLVGFSDKPELAVPDKGLTRTLETLCRDRRSTVVIVSGRDKAFLDGWFGRTGVGLVAEHGVWSKAAGASSGEEWVRHESARDEWKVQIRPILEYYADRTPGAFVEEKEFSLVWHYRKADPEFSALRSGELKNSLFQLTCNLDLGILDGDKVVEIRNMGVSKGQAARRWLEPRERWDFILAAGDDVTDEDLFAALPEFAHSVKVGLPPTHAKVCVDSHGDVRILMDMLAGVRKT